MRLNFRVPARLSQLVATMASPPMSPAPRFAIHPCNPEVSEEMRTKLAHAQDHAANMEARCLQEMQLAAVKVRTRTRMLQVS